MPRVRLHARPSLALAGALLAAWPVALATPGQAAHGHVRGMPAAPAVAAGHRTGPRGATGPTGPAGPPGPGAPGPYQADRPLAQTLYRNGQDGRFLMAGTWLFRLNRGAPDSAHLERSRSTAGWKRVTVPYAWNAQDSSNASMAGTVAWYRKDFRLPSAAGGLTWIVRFESANYRMEAWINGHSIGTHAGAFLPFELAIPGRLLRRAGANRLVVRVDNRRRATDFPAANLTSDGTENGGWWNDGGLLREVYLRRANRIDLQTATVIPDLRCPSCPAVIRYRVVVHNYARGPQHVTVRARFGALASSLGSATIAGGGEHTFVKRATLAAPHLWSPSDPHLYDVNLDASAGGARSHWFLRSGVRSIRVSPDGLLLLNGQVLHFRGVALHEDSKQLGFAIDSSVRRRLFSEVRDLGATVIRAHYPLHPELQELADANGVMLWSEVPVYQLKYIYLKYASVRRRAAALVAQNVATNASHPSVIVWSIANELSSKPDANQGAYIREAVAAAHRLDPTRPVGIAIASYPSAGCQARRYAPLQVIGMNDYFGWYPGPSGDIADREELSDYLDSMRLCYPHKALIVTEFGAEANRVGPVEERGTYAFQQDFVNYHLNLFASKPWLGGAIYWALEEFRVRPGWSGGNPRPDPPVHEKGLISFDGVKKPAYFDVQRIYHAADQLHHR